MELTNEDRKLLAALENGLPLTARPYEALARALGTGEAEVIARLARLKAAGTVKRFGVVVRHHELGYRANAMVVWDVPDAAADEAGRRLADLPFVTLSYRRARCRPQWPYNLFCMIHGRDRAAVEALIEQATAHAGLSGRPRAVLFSRRRFKQRGARYVPAGAWTGAGPEPAAGAAQEARSWT
jgi:DNA-binding Lrp family transcriptional regulator